MALTLRSAAHSEIGLVRKTNQDSAYSSPRLAIVADGMGGAAAGDLASAVAIAEIVKLDADLDARLEAAAAGRPENAPTGLPDGPEGDLLAVLSDTLAAANADLADLVAGDRTLDGMGTTLCGFVLLGDGAGLVNIGDSRAYLVRDGVLDRVSRDHSWVQTLVDEGRITEEEALEHPHRSLILRVLNGKIGHVPDLEFLDLRAGDRLLVCSDGLCGLVTDAAIASRIGLEDREEVVSSLVGLAHEAGGYDNITIIVADVVDGEPEGAPRVLGSAQAHLAPSAAEQTGRIPVVDPRQAATSAEDVRYAPVSRRGSRLWLKAALAVLVPALALSGGAYAWYSYTQSRFYLGPHDAQVALYQGVPDTVLGRPLSSVVAEDGVLIDDLPTYVGTTVKNTIQVDSLEAGRARLAEFKALSVRCIAQRAARARNTPTPAVTTPPATGTPSPDATPTTALPSATTPTPASPTEVPPSSPPSVTATASVTTAPVTTASPSAAPTQPTALEDC